MGIRERGGGREEGRILKQLHVHDVLYKHLTQ